MELAYSMYSTERSKKQSLETEAKLHGELERSQKH